MQVSRFELVMIALFVTDIAVDHAPSFEAASTTSDSMVRAG